MKESQLHQAFGKWLDRDGIPFVHSRTDKRHTNAVGDPDFFVLLAGRVLAIEFKVGSNKLSEAQTKRIEYLRRAGISVKILASVEQAVSAVEKWLGVESPNSCSEGGSHQWDICRGPLHDTRLGQLICVGCGTTKWKSEQSKSDDATRVSAVTDPFILTFQGKDAVFIGDPSPGGQVQRIRTATPADLVNLPRR